MDARINEWLKLKFVDPAKALPQLREIQKLIATSNLTDRVKNLRTHKLRRHREGWEATLFCYGMSKLLNTTVYISPHETSDYDAVSMWVEGDMQHFAPIQIKELVPKNLNPNTDINQEISKLQKYPVSNDTIVVIHFNRSERLEVPKTKIPTLNISQLWILGALAPDQSKWFIAGNLLDNPKIFEFIYPQ